MKFLAITLIVHNDKRSPTERFREVVDNAVLAEELGFDGFGVGERHERPFISSSPPVVLSHIAARTSRIRLFTAVTTLSLLDPVRAFEDYATLDHLSDGRLELIIGKGNGAAQAQLFHVTAEDQWDRNREGYDLFRRLWREDKVTWAGRFRPALTEAETWPRPLQRPIRVWHGSATSKESVDLAARYGDPLFSANVTNPIEPYADLIDYYREQWARYGHDPADALVGAGTAGYYAARTSQEAIDDLPADLRRPAGAVRQARDRAGLRHAGGRHRTQLDPGRQPAADHRQGAALPRAVRARGHAPARRRRRSHADSSTGTRWSCSRRRSPPYCARRSPAGRSPEGAASMTGPCPSSTSPPIPSGGTARDALRNTIDLARRAERVRLPPLLARRAPSRPRRGQHRPGRAHRPGRPRPPAASGSAPAPCSSGTRRRCRWWSSSACSTRCIPGRIDLGLGRSGQRARRGGRRSLTSSRPAAAGPGEARGSSTGCSSRRRSTASRLAASPALRACHASLLQQPGAQTPDFAEQIDDVLAFLAGTYRRDGTEAHAVPGEGAEVELWILGSSGGESAQVAGERGLPFAANYHVSPSSVLEAVEGYRAAFRAVGGPGRART